MPAPAPSSPSSAAHDVPDQDGAEDCDEYDDEEGVSDEL